MVILEIILSGFLVGLVSALPIGVSALEIVRRGICYGFLAAFFVALGTVTSDIIYSSLAFFGVSNYIVNNPLMEEVGGIVGAIIIAFLGIYIIYEAKINREAPLKKLEKKEWPPYLAGVVITIFNPFNLLFWTGVTSLIFRSRLVDGDRLLGGIFLIAAVLGIFSWTLFLSYISAFGKFNLKSKFKQISNQIIGFLLILAALVIIIGII